MMSKERILIADDETDVLDLCVRVLSADGYRVEGVEDGLKAVERAQEEPFDLLLTDIKMPGLSGLETAQAIKLSDPDIVCVTMTGYGTMNTAIEALKLGVDEFVIKPFTPDELMAAVTKALEKARLRRENARLRALIPLFELNKTFMTTVDVNDLIDQVVRISRQETKAERAALLLVNDAEQTPLVRAMDGFPPDELARGEEGCWEIGKVAMQSKQPLSLSGRHDRNGQFANSMDKLAATSVVAAPLLVKDRPIGVLVMTKTAGSPPFVPSDVELLSVLCGQVSIAIENARLFEEIQRAYKELKRLDHMKSEFINIAAHELRTPLAILMGYASLLEEEASGPERERLEIIMRNAMRLRSLIDDMLNLRYLEAGEVELRIEEVYLGEAVDAAIDDLRPLAENKEHTITVELPPDLPAIETDRGKVILILTNLLSNAIKFTPPGGHIRVKAQATPDEIEVVVSDTGVGIPLEEYDKVFDRFYQVEDSLTRQHGGIGLGLSIVKGMLDLLGGRIWLESEVNRGSAFHFTLPYDPPRRARENG